MTADNDLLRIYEIINNNLSNILLRNEAFRDTICDIFLNENIHNIVFVMNLMLFVECLIILAVEENKFHDLVCGGEEAMLKIELLVPPMRIIFCKRFLILSDSNEVRECLLVFEIQQNNRKIFFEIRHLFLYI